MIVDSLKILNAMQWYQLLGYEPVSVPMLVDEMVSDFTKPESREDLKHNGLCYVASAEQSFFQRIINNDIGDGRYQAITPCYRDEPVLDEYHFRIFLKIELFVIGSYEYKSVKKDAEGFFRQFTEKLTTVKTESGLDLEINGFEVGSYGTRVFKGKNICYGTGIAEPRLTYALTYQ